MSEGLPKWPTPETKLPTAEVGEKPYYFFAVLPTLCVGAALGVMFLIGDVVPSFAFATGLIFSVAAVAIGISFFIRRPRTVSVGFEILAIIGIILGAASCLWSMPLLVVALLS